jgi:amino acid transporter
MTDLLSLALPFIFSFIIVYGGLEFTGTFSRRVNSVIAAVIALFAMSVPQVSEFINSVLPYAVVLFVALFFIGLLATFYRKVRPKEEKEKAEPRRLEFWIIILGLLLLILATQSEALEDMFPGTSSAFETAILGAGVLIILILLYWAFSRGGEK